MIKTKLTKSESKEAENSRNMNPRDECYWKEAIKNNDLLSDDAVTLHRQTLQLLSQKAGRHKLCL
jgi:hypothetical protein